MFRHSPTFMFIYTNRQIQRGKTYVRDDPNARRSNQSTERSSIIVINWQCSFCPAFSIPQETYSNDSTYGDVFYMNLFYNPMSGCFQIFPSDRRNQYYKRVILWGTIDLQILLICKQHHVIPYKNICSHSAYHIA